MKLFRKIRNLFKKIFCRHTHTFSFYPEKKNTFWNYQGKSKGSHDGIVIKGCYICGKILGCEDYKK